METGTVLWLLCACWLLYTTTADDVPRKLIARQLWQNGYLSNPGGMQFTEPSFRDLDVDLAVGVKDGEEESPVPRFFDPASDQQQWSTIPDQNPSSKEINMGVFVDPVSNLASWRMFPENLYPPLKPERPPYQYLGSEQPHFPGNWMSPVVTNNNNNNRPRPYPYMVKTIKRYPAQPTDYYQDQSQTLGPVYPPVQTMLPPNFPLAYNYGMQDRSANAIRPGKQLILDEHGTPFLTAEPYGRRQVGAFQLRNDQGYHATLSVPPAPSGAADGVLVMEMKATLYRPVS